MNYFSLIYKIVRQIPKEKVATYGQIAKIFNTRYKNTITAQFVGWALHANKDKNTPCHRVVDRNGRLAPNFGPRFHSGQAFDGWKEQKRRLLEEEIGFIDENHVDLEKYIWKP